MRADRRSPRTRLILTLAALASLIGGYYAGQYWQRRPLADLSAILYPAGRPVDYPAGLGIDTGSGANGPWRLFVVADTRATQCRELVRHFASVINRLAAWPQIQARLRLTLLAYDRPDAQAVAAFSGGTAWLEVVSADPASLDLLSAQLGITPGGSGWCEGEQSNGILVSPNHAAWALIPHEQAAIMADNIRTLIAFLE